MGVRGKSLMKDIKPLYSPSLYDLGYRDREKFIKYVESLGIQVNYKKDEATSS